MTLSKDDFLNCGWETIVENAMTMAKPGPWNYHMLDAAFQKAFVDAREQGDSKNEKIFLLLVQACAMILNPSNSNEPYEPFMSMDGMRDALPQDFQPEDVNFFAQIAGVIDEPLLCARIADLVWLCRETGKIKHAHEFALLAIRKYMELPVNSSCWVHGSRDGWARAVNLCRGLKSVGANKLQEIEYELFSTLNAAVKKNKYTALQISEFLLEHDLCRTQRLEIAEKIATLAKSAPDRDSLYAKDCFDHVSALSKKLGNVKMYAEMTAEAAKLWEKDAKIHPNPLAYEEAYVRYLSIPKKHRKKFNVEKQLDMLSQTMKSTNLKLMSEMKIIRVPDIDISKSIAVAKNMVERKHLGVALFALTNIYSGAKETEIRKITQKSVSESVLRPLVKNEHFVSDGRKVAIQPGIGADGNDEQVVSYQMIETYHMQINFKSQAGILPALEVMRQEHPLQERDFCAIVEQSPIVPPDHKMLVAKGLCAGYNGDFAIALHMLAPQLENMVRVLLQQKINTATFSPKSGVQDEVGLNTLLDLPKATEILDEILGEGSVFEIRSLFCEKHGPNLRNNVAHGLLDDAQSQSNHSVYAWWFIFHLVYNSARKTKIDEQHDQSPPSK